MKSDEEVPIKTLCIQRDQLNRAVDEADWNEASRLARLICEGIPIAIDPKRCRTGTPHLDGLYSLGTMRYMRAPEKAKKALRKMNRILKTAKHNIPRKGK